MDTFEYKFIVKEYDLPYIIDEKVFSERAIGIGKKDTKNDIIAPSPLTSFIRSSYRGKYKSISSQRNAASELTKFLNFIVKQVKNRDEEFEELRKNGLFGLNLYHGARYITYNSLRARSGEISSDYVYRMEKYLIKFYLWLVRNDIINIDLVNYTHSPFDDLELGTIYPGRNERIQNKLVDFGERRFELVCEFIKISKKIVPEISLGICFQFFGGLRTGEVVNLTKDAISTPYYWDSSNIGESKFFLEIRDRQKILFCEKKNLQHEQVKRPRNQSLIVNTILSEVYRDHKMLLERIEKKNEIRNSAALFLSSRTRKSITGKSYKEKFSKVKVKFLDQLSNVLSTEDYLYFIDKDWSTHIGRGVFTNILLEIGATIPEIAIARGDKNINSVLAYVEEKNAIKLTTEAINKLHEEFDKERVQKLYNDVQKRSFKYE